MRPKAVTIPRSEATLDAWAIFHFCVFLMDVSISCSMVSECTFTYWTLEILMPKVFMYEDGYNFLHLNQQQWELPWTPVAVMVW